MGRDSPGKPARSFLDRNQDDLRVVQGRRIERQEVDVGLLMRLGILVWLPSEWKPKAAEPKEDPEPVLVTVNTPVRAQSTSVDGIVHEGSVAKAVTTM